MLCTKLLVVVYTHTLSYKHFLFVWSQDSIVSLVTRQQVGWSWVWIPELARFFTSSNCPDWFWGPHSVLFSGYWTSLLGVKHLGHKVDHSSLSSPKVENKWNYISTPNTCLHGIEWNNSFTLLLPFTHSDDIHSW